MEVLKAAAIVGWKAHVDRYFVDPRPYAFPAGPTVPDEDQYYPVVSLEVSRRLAAILEMGLDTATALPVRVEECPPLYQPGERGGCPSVNEMYVVFGRVEAGDYPRERRIQKVQVQYWPTGSLMAAYDLTVIQGPDGVWRVSDERPIAEYGD